MSIPLSECHWVNPGEQLKEGETWKERQGFDTASPFKKLRYAQDDHITFDFSLPQQRYKPRDNLLHGMPKTSL